MELELLAIAPLVVTVSVKLNLNGYGTGDYEKVSEYLKDSNLSREDKDQFLFLAGAVSHKLNIENSLFNLFGKG